MSTISLRNTIFIIQEFMIYNFLHNCPFIKTLHNCQVLVKMLLTPLLLLYERTRMCRSHYVSWSNFSCQIKVMQQLRVWPHIRYYINFQSAMWNVKCILFLSETLLFKGIIIQVKWLSFVIKICLFTWFCYFVWI
jgi:hypothetical protein